MKNAIVLMMSDSYGVYIPQNFVDDIDLNKWHVSQEDADTLAKGPDDECYWDTWTDVLDTAYYVDEDGNKFTLHQDGDLWALCPELMTNEEHVNFFDEMKPAPDDAYEYHVCSNCLIALANDDYTGMDDDEEKATMDGLAVLHRTYQMVIPDGAEYGFEHANCECCNGLSGDRFRVLCFDKKEGD